MNNPTPTEQNDQFEKGWIWGFLFGLAIGGFLAWVIGMIIIVFY